MSDYIDETPLTEEEIAAAIAAAKKAKAEKAKAKNQNKSRKPDRRRKNNDKAQEEESSENLFDEIDSVSDDEENLSPKMKSARSFSNAFAAAKNKRENDLRTIKEETQSETNDVEETQDYIEDSEEENVVFETDNVDEYEEYYDEESADFEVDSEEENYEEYSQAGSGEEEDDEEYDGIFEADSEEGEYSENVDDDEYDDEDEDEDEDAEEDDDEDESTFSTKTKVIIGIIIAILVLAIVGAGIFFLTRGESSNTDPSLNSQASDGSVTGIHFAEPSIDLRVGQTVPLEIVVEPESAKDKVLKIKSNDPAVAKVDEQGRITGVSSGSTTVTATLKSNETITASLIVNVIDDDQDAINTYNKFVNSILDGSTDIDSDSESDTDSDEEQPDQLDELESTDSDTDSEAQTTPVQKDTLTGSMIRDLDSDGSLDLALYYRGEQDSSKVRIFRLADPNEAEEEQENEEPQYDEYGNLIESEDTETDIGTDTSTEQKSDANNSSEKVITEIAEGTELYTVCYSAIESDASWNTCYVEIKEEESTAARVTILSSGYESPSYVYESEDQTIATVDNQGNIKGLKPGTTFVTVTSPLNSQAMAKIKVRVKDDTDLLDDYLANIPVVNQTNDSVFPTETLTGKAIVDIDNDGVSELLLRFDYGNHVQTINMVKVENDQCVVYKTYNNLSDLYEYNEGDGYYSNAILIHYTTGKVFMEYRGVVAKTDSNTKTSEQKILSLGNSGSLTELVTFKTTTDITTKTVTSEVVVDDNSDVESSDNDSTVIDDDSDVWYDSDDDNYDDYDDTTSEDNQQSYYDDNGIEASYAQLTFDDIVAFQEGGINLNSNKAEKKLPQAAAAPDDDYDDDGDYNDDDSSSEEEEPGSSITSTVTSEVTEEVTKYFVNGSPVEQSVYEEMLSTYSARYSVWNAWEGV